MDYKENLLQNLNQLRLQNKFCDMILVVDEVEFTCHSYIFYSASSYFRCLIDYIVVGESRQRIEIPGVDAVTFENIIQFIYTGVINLTWDNITNLVLSADYLLINQLLQVCIDFIFKEATKEYCTFIYQLCHYIGRKSLVDTSDAIMAKYFCQLEPHCLFMLDKKDIVEIMKIRSLIVYSNSKPPRFYTGFQYQSSLTAILQRWYECSDTDEYSKSEDDFSFILNTLYQTLDRKDETTLNKTYAQPFKETLVFRNYFGSHPETIFNQVKVSSCSNTPPHEWTIKSVKLYIIPNWDNKEVIAGMDLEYRQLWTDVTLLYSCGYEDEGNYMIEHFEIENDERIIQLEVYHDMLLNSITFTTDKSRIFGPFGSEFGFKATIDIPNSTPLALYWHGIVYTTFQINNQVDCFNRVSLLLATLDRELFKKDFMWTFPSDYGEKLKRKKAAIKNFFGSFSSAERVSEQPVNTRSESAQTTPILRMALQSERWSN